MARVKGERGPGYTLEELMRAATLRTLGLTWREVAERLGRDPKSLEVVSWRWRHGKLAKNRWSKTTRVEEMIRLTEAGVKPGVIAKRFGMSVQNVCMTLSRRGYDGEVRQLYRGIPLLQRAL